MSEELDNELQAIQSIYGDDAIKETDLVGVYVLSIPQTEASLRLHFPLDYPASIPEIQGTEKTGDHTRKGYGTYLVNTAREILEKVFIPGSVCLFDLLQEVDLALTNRNESHDAPSVNEDKVEDPELLQAPARPLYPELQEEPFWILSNPLTEKKSTFLARACAVKSHLQAKASIAHLLNTDKRAAKATHNITAYRIRSYASAGSTSENIYQDCDDDGETAAGGRLLHLLQVMDVWDVLVVVSRWYGGVKLGPDRFSLINNVAREALVEGEWTTKKTTKE